ncbi:hypothetical protein ACOTVS_09805 [Aliarcobacter butzleri]|uniref:hypothetical protein n=1 Tax=Aliarcobacter butzleri TaxID=28197 RepID=UPI00344C5A45
MKNLNFTLLVTFMLGLNGCSVKQEIKNEPICPVLNIENTTKEQKELAKGISINLQNASKGLFVLYEDILKHYNNTNDVEKYINEKSLIELGSSQIWGALAASYYLSEKDENMKSLYNNILDTIDANNPNWCNQESYEKTLRKKDTK